MYGIAILWEGGVLPYKKGIIVRGKFWRETLTCTKILAWLEFLPGGTKSHITDYTLSDYFDLNTLKGMAKAPTVNVLRPSKLSHKLWRPKLSILHENIQNSLKKIF